MTKPASRSPKSASKPAPQKAAAKAVKPAVQAAALPGVPAVGPVVLVASGASGGHLFPALAVADELRTHAPKADVTLVLGGRKFMDIVARTGVPYVRLPAAAFNDRGPVGLVWALTKLVRGFAHAFMLVRKRRPNVVFGTGGYASVALLLAARMLGVPTIIQEQNVLPGRANRFLARFADVVLLTFEESRKYLPKVKGKVIVTGTPLRKEILQTAAGQSLRAKKTGFHLLVLGGSQGARILSEVLPETLSMLTPAERKKLHVVHQARAEDVDEVKLIYKNLGLAEFVVQPFFADMPERYADADLLVGRSGVGTVLEAATFGLPAIYVPLELADGHQKLNAGVAELAGAAVVVEQAYFTPANLLVHVRGLWADSARRTAMSAAARTLAKPRAAAEVAKAIRNAATQPGCCCGKGHCHS
jgi:UDP-N-acetylglucosamine--N-acetylmuramyl-(pentapeptide) pyrophosphoryl-undecaprenol N-acetylglucosamine transferase